MDYFYGDSRVKSGLTAVCKSCIIISSKKWRMNNQERVRKTCLNWYKKNKERVKDRRLRRDYDITIDDYNKMLEEQGGCCKICGAHEDNFKKSLNIDHCHDTGYVRSLLCMDCNTGIGRFKEDVKILAKAIDYINKFKGGNKHEKQRNMAHNLLQQKLPGF